ncbi:prepilin-type N-terminal cleavage/methylation domain-containing protein [Acinetobacter bohemicus]|uniref:Type II secretion system protein H n=2 Tax=Acinetobacter bohemicus TaxID=1435036 RepID=A0A1I6S2L1_9GAMM|nr:prepilin-type N-terminal cleavage/methylation domain-containing protein [Acinetobacter bohemicus]
MLSGGSMQQTKKNQGFTLIELMVTVAIMAIIAMMAAPSFGDLVTRQKLNRSVRELALAINQAKSQAALMKTTVALCLNRTNSDNDFTKNECATVTIPEYTATNPGPPVVPVLTTSEKEEVLKSRVISIPVDRAITVASTSSVSILFNDVGSATTTATFILCKSPLMRTVVVTRLGIISQTSGTC